MIRCNSRDPNGVARCELEQLHDGDHQWSVGETTARWANLRDPKTSATRKANLGRSRPLARQSEKQKLLEAKWTGIKEAFIFLAQRYETDGRPHCEECGMAYPAQKFDLHHLRRRGQGGEYAARNAALVCRGEGTNRCHERLDGTLPQWTSSPEAFNAKFDPDEEPHPDDKYPVYVESEGE